jgi:5-hydroxyisourate hydrolase-like protein (transthyretin family)
MERRKIMYKSLMVSCKYLLSFLLLMFFLVPSQAWCKRTIKGTITYPDGRPASGFLVKAYDSDKDKDDFMGQATTDSRGRYSIGPYKAKHWDKAPHNVTTWRPDIYINVYGKINNKWVKVKKSKTYNNRKHKYDTVINLKLSGIQGTIREHTGKPARGILVKAWDEDDLLGGKNDFLNQVITDSQGRYFMIYEGKHWDPAPHNVTKWRPDIFIKVLRKVGRYGWVRVNRSKTHKDWKHANTLTINLSLPEIRWVTKKTAFNPKVHGWPFKNDSRKICAAPTCKDEHWTGKAFRKFLRFDWALCGGMSLTALRHFRNNQPVSNFSPKIKKELVQAQIETLTPDGWYRFIKWQARPDFPHPNSPSIHSIGSSTKGELKKLKRAINYRAPIIMGLIRVGPTKDPNKASSNHQVLGIGYRYNDGTKEVEIDVYDPNHPGHTGKISMNIGIPRNQLMAKQDTGEKVRGFLVNNIGSGPPAPKVRVGVGVKQQQ